MSDIYFYIKDLRRTKILILFLFLLIIISLFIPLIHIFCIINMIIIIMHTKSSINLFVRQIKNDDINNYIFLVEKYKISSIEPIVYIPILSCIIFFISKITDIGYIINGRSGIYPFFSLLIFFFLEVNIISLIYIVSLNNRISTPKSGG